MMTMRRSGHRIHERYNGGDSWLSFDPRNMADPHANGFGSLQRLNEHRLPPGATLPRFPHQGDAEIIISVREGAIAFHDSFGHSGVITTGEVQHMIVGEGTCRTETNASPTQWAHVFEIGIRPNQAELKPHQETTRFSAADRKGAFCVMASPDGRKGSLQIHQEALLYTAILEPGKHVALDLLPGRSAWLHLIQGKVNFSELILTTGDSAGVAFERSISLTAKETSEVLLFDMDAMKRMAPQRRWTQ